MNKIITIKRIQHSAIVLVTFAIAILSFRTTREFVTGFIVNDEMSYSVRMVLIFITLPIIITALLHRNHSPIAELGLKRNFRIGFGIAFLMCSPMLIGYMFFFKMSLPINQLIAYCLLASIGEEVLFRGFLFGQLFRRAKWGIILAEFVEALLFGLIHLHQANDISQALGIFAVTFFGGLWFAWLYAEWDYNLWISIGVHFLMNAYWYIFDVAHNALGGTTANVFRLMTILLSVYITIRHSRTRNNKMAINWTNLIINKNPNETLFTKLRNWWRQPAHNISLLQAGGTVRHRSV
ncbi:MAG: CPBP family intramembrane metalloprotease [Chryseotalea sp. WA131a]|nr:MAG: CPBP family intramembrane metalloprotease [Chryseotalea sp. WA131a]